MYPEEQLAINSEHLRYIPSNVSCNKKFAFQEIDEIASIFTVSVQSSPSGMVLKRSLSVT